MGLFAYWKKLKAETSPNKEDITQTEKRFLAYNEGRIKCNCGGYGDLLYDLITYCCFQEASDDTKIDFLRFAIDVVKMDIQSNYAVELRRNKMIVNPAILFPLEFIGQTGASEPYLLPPKGVCVLSFPWYAKDADAQKTLAGWYFPELNLALLSNRQRNGFANRLYSTEVTKIELKGFFDSLFTSLDGEKWEKRNASGEVKAS